MQQLSMMDFLCPPLPDPQLSLLDLMEPARPVHVPRPKRDVITRAYGEAGHVLSIDADAPDPVEVKIRGIRCLVVWDFGASIYTVQKPGALFWSSTGYRSMSTTGGTSLEAVVAAVEAHIDTPKAKYGLGGKAERWWPCYVSQWQAGIRFGLENDRETMWSHFGPEKQAALWAKRDAQQAAALARMWAEGIDPNDVGPPEKFKGAWPRFERNDHG